ncbi:TPA: hypothetical protein H1895_002390 [Salmonella enterica]|nr:hypothetical protein [Salmonella enterica]
MTNTKLTDERVLQRLSQFEGAYKEACVLQDDDFASECADIVRVLREVLERRNADGEPMAYTTEFYLQELNKSGLYQCWLSRDARNAEYSVPIFAASQSATLPPEMPAHTGPQQDGRPQAYADGWNACRDAMQYELQERRNADGAEPVSFDSLNAAVAEVTGCNQHTWNAAIYKGHHPVPSMNYNSLARIVDMYRSPRPTPAISCPKPVVKLPTTRCWAGISNFYYAADVIAAIRAAGVEVSND